VDVIGGGVLLSSKLEQGLAVPWTLQLYSSTQRSTIHVTLYDFECGCECMHSSGSHVCTLNGARSVEDQSQYYQSSMQEPTLDSIANPKP
jgi:hypothetical protein